MKKYIFVLFIAVMSCSERTKSFADIDLQGHRGARGLMPENTIEGFKTALDLGVNTLEMDLVITGDSQVLVSHEPFMSSEICMDSTGNQVSENNQLSFNIYKMTYDEIKNFDCGLKVHPRFPDQKKMSIVKPLLEEVIDAVNSHISEKNLVTPNYNLEIKSRTDGDNIYHPDVSTFSALVYDLVDEKLDWSKVTIQSFDFRVLRHFKENYPEVTLALLIENDLEWKENVDSLGFTPAIYSPDFQLLSSEIIDELHSDGMRVIPWTVNDRANMDRLLEWGVDGIITDYPDRTK